MFRIRHHIRRPVEIIRQTWIVRRFKNRHQPLGQVLLHRQRSRIVREIDERIGVRTHGIKLSRWTLPKREFDGVLGIRGGAVVDQPTLRQARIQVAVRSLFELLIVIRR